MAANLARTSATDASSASPFPSCRVEMRFMFLPDFELARRVRSGAEQRIVSKTIEWTPLAAERVRSGAEQDFLVTSD